MKIRAINQFIGSLCVFAATFGVAQVAFAQASPSAYTSAIRYDAEGRQTGAISPDPDGGGPLAYAATRTTYDAAGRPIKQETGELASWQSEAVAPATWSGFTLLSSVETTFDAMDRKLVEVAKGSNGISVSLTQYSYDNVGRLECIAQRMNPAAYTGLPSSACALGTQGSQGPDRITKNIHDIAGQLLKVQKAYGTTLQQDYATYTYTLNGKQASVKDANGNLATMTFDGHDRQIRWNFPSKISPGWVSTTDYEEYGYDANGNRTSLRRRDGSVLTYTYDALNRMTVKFVPERAGLSATHTRDVHYGYDLQGLQLYARFDSPSGEGITNRYDGFGRLVSMTQALDGATRVLTYSHDANGNRTQLDWVNQGAHASYSYDGLNRMTALYDGVVGSPTNEVAYEYNRRSMKASMTGRIGQVTSFDYDALGRLNWMAHDLGGVTHDVSHGFGYNPANQLTSRTTTNYGYVWTGGVNVNRDYAVNGLNQYTQAGSTSFTYDDNGNLTSSGAISYTYDVENRLVAVGGGLNAGLRYDPLGRLYEVVGPGATIRFLYDGDELVAEYNGISGALLRRYAHGRGTDDPVVWYEGTAPTSPRWLHADHQGSIVAITDASGNALAVNSYDEWGIPGSAALPNIGRFQYTGQIWVPEVGLYYYKARFYSPSLGRFMQVDPVGYDDGLNIYTYVGNDPVNLTDATGTTAGPVIGAKTRRILWKITAKIVREVAGAAKDFTDNNAEMRQEWRKGADKSYHCKANCEASSRGPIGEQAAEELSDVRELYGRAKGDSAEDEADDQHANSEGRRAGKEARQSSSPPNNGAAREKICRAACESQRPDHKGPRGGPTKTPWPKIPKPENKD